MTSRQCFPESNIYLKWFLKSVLYSGYLETVWNTDREIILDPKYC